MHKRDLTFHYVSATAMYEMDGNVTGGRSLLAVDVYESIPETYTRDREAYVQAENMRRKLHKR